MQKGRTALRIVFGFSLFKGAQMVVAFIKQKTA